MLSFLRWGPLRVILVRVLMRWPSQGFAIASLLDRLGTALGQRDPYFWRRGVMYIGHFHPSDRWPFPHVAAGPDPLALHGPMVLVGLHVGAVDAVGALLNRLPGEVVSLVDRQWPPQPKGQTISLSGGEWDRVAALKRAAEVLRSGGFVFLVADGMGNARVETALLGEKVSWSRGGFELARLTGSPMLPVLALWRGRKIEIVAGELTLPSDAATMAGSLAAWLERYASRRPGLVKELRA